MKIEEKAGKGAAVLKRYRLWAIIGCTRHHGAWVLQQLDVLLSLNNRLRPFQTWLPVDATECRPTVRVNWSINLDETCAIVSGTPTHCVRIPSLTVRCEPVLSSIEHCTSMRHSDCWSQCPEPLGIQQPGAYWNVEVLLLEQCDGKKLLCCGQSNLKENLVISLTEHCYRRMNQIFFVNWFNRPEKDCAMDPSQSSCSILVQLFPRALWSS